MRRVPSIVVSQILVLLYALALTFLPGEVYWIIITLFFITYMAIIMIINIRRMRLSVSSEDAQYVRSGRQIIRVDPRKSLEIMQTDRTLNDEIREQMKFTMMPLISLPIVFALYYIYQIYVTPHYINSSDPIVRLLGNLAMFEIFFLVPLAINKVYMRGKNISVIQPIMDYMITDRGIQGSGLLVKFPIEDQKIDIKCNRNRRFIEILREQQNPMGGKMSLHQRLYMEIKDIEKAIEAIRKYGKTNIQC
ncbi:MAG: DUF2208 family protein [Desulfurococcales archaeon]|nr:DUF2208 family protein [Desulfurococcales archaeon]